MTTRFGAILALLTLAVSRAQVLPDAQPPFQGKPDIDARNSTPDWPKPVTAPKGALNIVVILWDDTGFSATSTFGGAVPAPALDRLAADGLRYNRFHVTPMCSLTRAALLSGRNSHQIGFGRISELAAGYPGYNSLWPKSSASIAKVLGANGYSTAASVNGTIRRYGRPPQRAHSIAGRQGSVSNTSMVSLAPDRVYGSPTCTAT